MVIKHYCVVRESSLTHISSSMFM